jgi:hypothetical protein
MPRFPDASGDPPALTTRRAYDPDEEGWRQLPAFVLVARRGGVGAMTGIAVLDPRS